MTENPQKDLSAAIVCAALIIGGSLVFFGLQFKNSALSDEELASKITAGIEQYVADQEAKYKEQQAAARAPKQVDVDYTQYGDDDPVMGDLAAPVTIIEFSDYQCPFCRKFYNDILPQLTAEYIVTGKVKLIFRDLPLVEKHPAAVPAAIAANCARAQGGDAMYFKMHDAIFDGQNAIDRRKTVDIPDDALQQYAVNLGLDTAAFSTCVADSAGDQSAEIQKDMAQADALGIAATPTFLVNNWLIEGAESFETFQGVIEQELAGGSAQ